MPKLSELKAEDIKLVSAPAASAEPLRLSKLDPKDISRVVPAVPKAIEGTQALEKSRWDNVSLLDLPRDAMNFAAAYGENIPVVGPATVAGGERFAAGAKYLTDKLIGDGEPDYDAALAQVRSMNEAARAKRLEESPLAAGVLAPMMAAAMLPTPGAGLGGATGAMARIGGNVALTAADDLARGDLEGIPQDAGIVGGIQTIIEAAPQVKRIGLNRALKAAFGHSKKAYTETFKSGGRAKLDKTAKAIMEADEAGPALVTFGTTTEAIAPKAKEKKAFFGEKISEVGKAIDEVVPQSVDGAAIATKIRAELDSIAANPGTDAVRAKLTELADFYEAKGMMSFAEAQAQKNTYRWKPVDKRAPGDLIDQDVKNKIKMAIGESMDDAVANVAAANGMDDLAAQYARYKEQYGIYKPVEKFANERALANEAINVMSPSDKFALGLTGVGAFLGSTIRGQDPMQSGVNAVAAGAAMSAANNLMNRRGPAAAAVTAKFIGDLLESQPLLFGKFRSQLKAAEQKGGSKALMGTHEALLNSPDYQGIMNNLSEVFGSQQGDDVAVIDHPEMVATYKQALKDRKDIPPSERAKLLSKVNSDGFYTMDLRPYKAQFEAVAGERIGEGAAVDERASVPFERMMGLYKG